MASNTHVQYLQSHNKVLGSKDGGCCWQAS